MPPPTDAVERLRAFLAAHPEVTVTSEPGFLSHRAAWTNGDGDRRESVTCLSLSMLMDKLDAEFGQ